MSNPFNIKKTSTLIKNQANRAISSATKKMNEAYERHELLESLVQSLKDFFLNLGKPRMKIRKVYGPPQSKPFNDTMNEIEDDINILFAESETTQKSLYSDFNYSQIERSKIQYGISSALENIKNFELYASNQGVLGQSGSDIIIGHDSFTTMEHIDESYKSTSLADINTEDGIITLKLNGKLDQLHGSEIKPIIGQPFTKELGPLAENLVGDQSNGFPGNLHEVTPKSFDNEGAGNEDLFEFVSQHDGHVEYLSIADNNPDTWFEYEAVNIPDSTKRKYLNYGFDFQVGEEKINWAFNPMPDNTLRLNLRFTLPEPRLINWITFNPMIPPNSGAMPAIIDSITISKDHSEPSIKLNTSVKEDSSGMQVFTFDSIVAQTIDVKFKQETSFDINLGHYVYTRTIVTEERTKRLFRKDKIEINTDKQIIEGPGIPLEVTGIVVNQKNSLGNEIGGVLMNVGSIGYAAATIASTTLGIAAATAALPITLGVVAIGAALSSIFGSKETTILKDEISRSLQSSKGTRWCIGIQRMQVLSKTYDIKSDFVSKPWKSSSPIQRISLEVTDMIPNIFKESKEKNEWIKYFISIDSGINWHQINPQNKTPNDIPQAYVINSSQLLEDRNEKIGYLNSETDINNVLVRAELKRPKDIEQSETYTPIILDYSIKLQVEVNPE